MRGYLRDTASADRVFDLLCETTEGIFVYRSSLTCPTNPADDFVAAERLGDAVSFQNGQQWCFECRESVATLRALPPTPNRLALVD